MLLAGNSLVVQWLGLHAFTAEVAGSIPGQGTKIPQAARRGQKKKVISYITCILPILQDNCFLHYQSMAEPLIK